MVTLADVHTNQLDDPTTGLDGLNCTCACGATAIKWRWHNTRPTPDPDLIWPPRGGDVRHFCRDEDGSLDTEGGTNLVQVQLAMQRGWGTSMAVLTNGSFDLAWEFARDPECLVIWQIQYSVLHGTRWACSETFMGPHAAAGNAADDDLIKWSDPLADGRRPGIPRGIQTLPRHILREACGKLVVDPKTGRRRGLGRANFAVTRLLERPEPPPAGPADTGDALFNIGPSATYRDAVLKAGTVLYRDAALTVRHSAISKDTPLGFLGSTSSAHVVVNAGNSNYVRREDVKEIVPNERQYE